MQLKRRIEKLENEAGKNKTRYIVYAGTKPDIKGDNVVFLDWGDDDMEDGEWFEMSNDRTHEEWLKILDEEKMDNQGN